MTTCTVCNTPIVRGRGAVASDILFFSEFPGKEETNKGLAMVGRAGRVLDDELARAGFSQNRIYITNLWQHKPTYGGSKALHDACYDHFKILAEKLLPAYKYVMLMGSELAVAFLDGGIMSYSGLKVDGGRMPPGPVYYAMPNPAMAFHSGVGEIRLALNKFRERIGAETK